MNELERAITLALHAQGNTKEANKAYLEFIKANLMIPIEKTSQPDEPEVLFLTENQKIFLPVFSNMDFFTHWAKDIGDQIQILKLTGVNLLKGLGEQVTVCLNIGSQIYKEFNPDEIARMRSIILKFFGDK